MCLRMFNCEFMFLLSHTGIWGLTTNYNCVSIFGFAFGVLVFGVGVLVFGFGVLVLVSFKILGSKNNH